MKYYQLIPHNINKSNISMLGEDTNPLIKNLYSRNVNRLPMFLFKKIKEKTRYKLEDPLKFQQFYTLFQT